ncbi:GNAT family N-acetyltransferase [Thalassotalea euphylliae]|uniref:GNAT family N-acetyltransferase n=1 Tax=Thalassotalea euphylliae TaxID=1655234 RepID=UPI003637A5A1
MISSGRLTISPLTPSDWPFILELLNTEDFIEQIGDKQVSDKASALKYIATGPAKCQQENGFSLMAMRLDEGTPVGLCGLLKRDTLPFPDIGYALLPQYYRKGYTFEACEAVLAHFKALRPVMAITSHQNTASIKLLEKLGFAVAPSELNSDDSVSSFILY